MTQPVSLALAQGLEHSTHVQRRPEMTLEMKRGYCESCAAPKEALTCPNYEMSSSNPGQRTIVAFELDECELPVF